MTLQIDNIDKIGIGTWDFDAQGTALADVEEMNFGWYYNWRYDPLWDSRGGANSLSSKFVPTIWGRNEVDPALLDQIAKSSADALLGFNEPDNKSQADMSVEEALALWPELMATGLRLGSPAPTTEEAVGENSWLGQFMAGAEKLGYRVDFMAVHYYSDDLDVTAFKAYLEGLHEAYGRPIWVTEWALVDWENPDRFTQEEISSFALEAIHMMDDLAFVERHAWFGAYSGGDGWHINTELFDSAGQLTAIGDVFAGAIADGVGGDDQQITGTDGDDTLYGEDGNDVLSGGDGDDRLLGRADDDALYGGAGNDVLGGGGGNDLLIGAPGDDRLYGGPGGDTLSGGAGADRLLGKTGADVLHGGAGNDVAAGGDGHDRLFGGADGDRLYGGAGDDRLVGNAGPDVLRGGAGNDVLAGGGGNDRLFGGTGGDLLRGGPGNDTLAGGDGADRFVFQPGGDKDTVLDFEAKVDLLDFRPFDFDSHSDVLDLARQNGPDVVVEFDDGQVVQLNSFSLALLGAEDILF